MSAIDLVSIFLVVELILLLICLVAILLFAFYGSYRDRQHLMVQENFSRMFMAVLLHEQKLDAAAILAKPFALQDLLLSVESFDRRFCHEDWINIKRAILTEAIMNKARRWTRSSNWTKRNIGVRFMCLSPHLEDEERIFHLIDDPYPLVRIPAARCAIQLGTKRLVKKVLERMTHESDLGRFPYRDILVKADKPIFNLVEEIFKEEKNKQIQTVCLDVLSSHASENLIPYITDYLNSEHVEDKEVALKILANSPSQNSVQYLLKYLKDEKWQIRAEAAKGLGQLFVRSALPELVETLKDPVWQVRLEAGIALKKLGEEGYAVLSSQDPDINLEAYQAAQYVLAVST